MVNSQKSLQMYVNTIVGFKLLDFQFAKNHFVTSMGF